MRAAFKRVPLERWVQLMIGGFKTVNLAWINEIAVIGCTWLFVYESARNFEERMNAALGHVLLFVIEGTAEARSTLRR